MLAHNSSNIQKCHLQAQSPTAFIFCEFQVSMGGQNKIYIHSYFLELCSELCSMFELESEILYSIHRRIVQNFLGVMTLLELRKCPLSCYDVISFDCNKVHMLLSLGTVYSYLFSLKSDGLVGSRWVQREDDLVSCRRCNIEVDVCFVHELQSERDKGGSTV